MRLYPDAGEIGHDRLAVGQVLSRQAQEIRGARCDTGIRLTQCVATVAAPAILRGVCHHIRGLGLVHGDDLMTANVEVSGGRSAQHGGNLKRSFGPSA